jgi:hypothetical protein
MPFVRCLFGGSWYLLKDDTETYWITQNMANSITPLDGVSCIEVENY